MTLDTSDLRTVLGERAATVTHVPDFAVTAADRGRRTQRRRVVSGVAGVAVVVAGILGITQLGPARTDPFPTGYPAHLSGAWCGDEGQPYGPCPGPGVPWQVRGSRDHRHASEIYDDFEYFTARRSRD